MKVLLIEDESLAAKKLTDLLKKIDQNIYVLNVLETVEESINWFNSNEQPDLIFMDIQLNDGVCFEIFQTVKIESPVIFTTAYDQYAIRAFKVNSIDYLLKPIKIENLKQALNKFNTVYNKSNIDHSIHQIIERFSKKYKERFFVKIGSRFKSILCIDIACFYVSVRNVFIYTSDGKSIGIDLSLDRIEDIINPDHFFRVNRGIIININFIQDIVSYSTSRLKLIIKNWSEPNDILVSRDRVSDFKKWIDR